MNSIIQATVIIVMGALLGSALGRVLGQTFPSGKIHDFFAAGITAGLSPTHIDLRVIDLTFGCIFRFNTMSIAGILIAAFLYKLILK